MGGKGDRGSGEDCKGVHVVSVDAVANDDCETVQGECAMMVV